MPNMKLKGFYHEKMKKRDRLAKQEFLLQESYKFGKKNASDAEYELSKSPKRSSGKKQIRKLESRYQLVNKSKDSPQNKSSQRKIALALSDHLSE